MYTSQTRQQKLKPIFDRFEEKWAKDCAVGDGWVDLIVQLDKDLSTIDPKYKVHQVKEKFGGLRYYVGHKHNDECMLVGDNGSFCKFDALINKAEKESYKLCEKCGKPGQCGSKGYWYSTLCPEHQPEGFEALK